MKYGGCNDGLGCHVCQHPEEQMAQLLNAGLALAGTLSKQIKVVMDGLRGSTGHVLMMRGLTDSAQ